MLSLESVFQQLNDLEDRGQYERALLLLSRFPEELGRRPDVLRRRGKLLQHLGRYAEAVDVLQRAGEDERSSGALRECVAEQTAFLECLGCHEEAANARGVVLSRTPDDVRGLIDQGVSFGMADDYQRAIACFERVIAVAPQNETAWYNKGIALLDIGQLQAALECFERTLAIDRANGQAWHHKAVCLVRQAQSAMPWSQSSLLEQARQCLGKALRITPDLDEAQQLLRDIQG